MATLGGTTEVEYTQNNIEIDNLALFAVQEHNIKQVFFFFFYHLNFVLSYVLFPW
jgi:hypothetical protein